MRSVLDVLRKDIVNVWNMPDPENVSNELLQPVTPFTSSSPNSASEKTRVPVVIVGVGRGSI
jgi:hypothetical protein